MKSKGAEKRFLIGVIGVLLLLTIFPYMSQGAIPQKMNYQGYLTNAAGVPDQWDIADGLYDLQCLYLRWDSPMD